MENEMSPKHSLILQGTAHYKHALPCWLHPVCMGHLGCELA